jgi:hypothetical protein
LYSFSIIDLVRAFFSFASLVSAWESLVQPSQSSDAFASASPHQKLTQAIGKFFDQWPMTGKSMPT